MIGSQKITPPPIYAAVVAIFLINDTFLIKKYKNTCIIEKIIFLCYNSQRNFSERGKTDLAYKREWQRPLELDRPTWDMLRENNIYTDSRRDFRWRHCPDKENGVIRAAVYTVMSYEHADDVVEKFVAKSIENGIDVIRIFDALNDIRNLETSIKSARKEKGAHGIEERGIYRIHQFEKQEMIVICKPEESMDWFHKMWSYSVELFRSLDIPVRTLECCTGDLADLKVKSYDVEAWSPKQQKYFEVCSCSNLGDAQARRLGIRVKGEDGKKYLAHTLNNTVVAPPRMLIAFLENNLCFDGERYSVKIPKALRAYMGGKEEIVAINK